jgi:hypothetical protein
MSLTNEFDGFIVDICCTNGVNDDNINGLLQWCNDGTDTAAAVGVGRDGAATD